VVIKYALSTIGLQSLTNLVEIYIILHHSRLSLQAVKNNYQRAQGRKQNGFLEARFGDLLKEISC
jgi:hypothetical protein